MSDRNEIYLIHFEDPDIESRVYFGKGAKESAYQEHENLALKYNVTLFKKVKANFDEGDKGV